MIDQNDVIAFFNRQAPKWDAEMIRSDTIIARILDNAHVGRGSRVLDVACGTGVLIPDYLARQVASVTAIDISPEMIRLAAAKFPQENLHFLCGDVEAAEVGADYDAIVVYNAFPHFPDGARLIRRLASLLREGGTLTVAHGMSRAAIDAHHHGAASHVSNGLIPVTELAVLFSDVLEVGTIISDESMYQVTGRRASVSETSSDHVHKVEDGFPAEALLEHTVQHNASHLESLLQLASHMEGPAHDEILRAAELMRLETGHLETALRRLRGN